MTTVTIEAPTPVEVLNQKKRFAQRLDANDAARFDFDMIKKAPRRAREGVAAALRALRLDSLAAMFGEKTSALYEWARMRAAGLLAWVSDTLGWTNVLAYAATHQETRNKVLIGAGTLYDTVIHKPMAFIGRTVRMVPFIGAPLVDLVSSVGIKAEDFVYDNVIKAASWLDDNDNRPALRWLRAGAAFALVRRAIGRIVPPQFRVFAWTAYFLRAWGGQAASTVRKVANDPAVKEAIDINRAAAAKSSDVLVDRVLDGPGKAPVPADAPPAMHTTQPGVEILDITVIKTGERAQLPVTVDVNGQKWVKWDDVTYSVDELPDEIGVLPVDLASMTARLDEAHRAADANGAAPHTEPRAVARALAATAPRKSGARARTGNKHR